MSSAVFTQSLLPHATEAIGSQHGWLVRWAIAKAAQECGWDLENVLIRRANNCLGIHGGWRDKKGIWRIYGGPVLYLQDSLADGRNDGRVPWRVFPDLTACFRELVKMWNDRDPYDQARSTFLEAFEHSYTGNLIGHADAVALNLTKVTDILLRKNIVDEKGRLITPHN